MADTPHIPDLRDWIQATSLSPDDIDRPEEMPMTDEQASRLKALCWQRGVAFDHSLSEAEADRRIAELQRRG